MHTISTKLLTCVHVITPAPYFGFNGVMLCVRTLIGSVFGLAILLFVPRKLPFGSGSLTNGTEESNGIASLRAIKHVHRTVTMSQENVNVLLSILGGSGITRTAGESQPRTWVKLRALFFLTQPYYVL